MPEHRQIVINTGPLIALVAALGDLSVLQKLYHEVLVPLEVSQEILAKGPHGFAYQPFVDATWLKRKQESIALHPILLNSLDTGEASVIQLALNQEIQTVCIDEAVGRRIARLYNLSVTGSIGILLRAKREGHISSIREAIERMKDRGIWLGENVVAFALKQSNEQQ